jgi:tripeptidyl-peptidase-1
MVAPKDDSRELVEQWLKSAGLSDHATISPRADSVIVEASIAQVEKLLNAEYEAFGKSKSTLTAQTNTFQSTTILELLQSEL